MKPEEIREWDKAEIETRIVELKEELFRLKFRSATMALENPRLVPNIRKDIARVVLLGLRQLLAVEGMRDATLYDDRHGLVGLVALHRAHARLALIALARARAGRRPLGPFYRFVFRHAAGSARGAARR